MKRPPHRERRERYVVVVPQGLGDSLEATPMFVVLRNAKPSAHIVAVVLRPAARELFLRLPDLVDEVVYLPYWEQGVLAFLLTAARLPFRPRADAMYLTYPAARPIYLVLASLVAARERYVHAYDGSWIRRLLMFGKRTVVVRPVHNVLRNVDALLASGVSGRIPERYRVPSAWISHTLDSKRIVLHVGTIAHDGLEARRWSEDRFAELGRRLGAHGFEISLLSGPAERDATARVANDVPGSRIVSGSLEEAARFVGSAALLIANDNGIAHLASGVGTPVLALFGPTPVEHGPYAPDALAFRPSACPPCFDVVRTDARCKLDIDYACLKADMSVDVVEREALRLIKRGREEGSIARLSQPPRC